MKRKNRSDFVHKQQVSSCNWSHQTDKLGGTELSFGAKFLKAHMWAKLLHTEKPCDPKRNLTREPHKEPEFKVTHISELDQAQLSQFTDTVVGWARLKEQLHQAHLLTAKQGAHVCLNGEKKVQPNNSDISPGNLSAWPRDCRAEVEFGTLIWVKRSQAVKRRSPQRLSKSVSAKKAPQIWCRSLWVETNKGGSVDPSFKWSKGTSIVAQACFIQWYKSVLLCKSIDIYILLRFITPSEVKPGPFCTSAGNPTFMDVVRSLFFT